MAENLRRSPQTKQELLLADIYSAIINGGGGVPLATEATQLLVEANTAGINANLTKTLRVPLLQRLGLPAAVDSGNIATGKRSVSFLNAGSVDITIATGVLKPGESITFNAGGQGDTLGPIPYNLPATADCVVTSIT